MASTPSRRAPFLPRPPDEEIDPALLDSLPDVEPNEPTFVPATQSDLGLLLETLQTEAQVLLAAQFARVHQQLLDHEDAMGARLAEANALVEQLREENSALLRRIDAFERAFSTLRTLTNDVDQV